MRALLLLALLPACNQIFGLEEPVGGGPTIDAAIGDAAADADVDSDVPIRLEGCADGTREGFGPGIDNIAACGGGFSQAGLTAPFVSLKPCANAGDDGPNPDGIMCAASNLCAIGWHICTTRLEVEIAMGSTDCGDGFEPGFYATNQGVASDVVCTTATAADGIVGCGDLGAAADGTSCTPLKRAAGNLCSALSGGWSCAVAVSERTTVTKRSAAGGGVLCCR